MKIRMYRSLIFDCDGVLLNSNKVKSKAFYKAALPFGDSSAHALVDYHVVHGGVSRYRKFEYFLQHIVPRGTKGPGLDALLMAYANEVHEGLLTCEVAACLRELRELTANAEWFIASGGDQDELRDIFHKRGLDHLFDGGIYGSPEPKIEIVQRLLNNNCLHQPSLFLGDSRYDHLVAVNTGMDFLFVSAWTEFSSWFEYCGSNQIKAINKLADLI